MKIGYGTYGMPEIPLPEALPRLADVGYESVEICLSERYPTAPAKLTRAERRQTRELLGASGLELSGFMLSANVLAAGGGELKRQMEIFQEACRLAKELAPDGDAPILSVAVGHGPLTWEKDEAQVVRNVAQFAAVAAAEGCRLAVEPHSGGILAQPERAVELMEQLRSRPDVDAGSVGINFDISHFTVIDYPMEESVALLAPYSLHTHVKDGRMENGKVRFLLPGEGGYDYAAYFRAMARAGWTGPITVEVSAMIFNQPGYDPWQAARFSLETLRRARQAAGLA